MSRVRRTAREDLAGTLRYHSEERFRLLIESVKDYAIFMLDTGGRVASWNGGAERITGYTAGEAVGAHFSQFYSQEARETHRVEHELALAAREGRTEDEGWRVGKGGERFWSHTVITALRDTQGALRGYAATFRDLSDRCRQQQQLAQTEERLRAVLAGVRDHGIIMLDPSGIIVGWSEGAEQIEGYRAEEIMGAHFSRFFPPEAIQHGWPEHELRMAGSEGRFEEENWRIRKDGSRFRAAVIVTALRDRNSQLMGFCMITRDLTERRHQEEALRESQERLRLLIESVREYAIYMLDASGHVISWNVGAQTLFGFEAAEIVGKHCSRLYPPEEIQGGKPWQQLEAAREQGRLESEGLRVRKDGTGFHAQVLMIPVHDPEGSLRGYLQVTHDLTRLQHMRVELHGGRIEARGEGAGRGAQFALPPADESSAVGPPADHASHRVLVVDDNVDSATSLAMLLQAMGFETQSAHDGVQALEAAERFGPDTVLLDIGLPRLDGYEVARRLRERGGRRPLLVALTGWGQDEDRARARDAGFDHHLVKPLDLKQLSHILQSPPVEALRS